MQVRFMMQWTAAIAGIICTDFRVTMQVRFMMQWTAAIAGI
jgi:hypothetical protein